MLCLNMWKEQLKKLNKLKNMFVCVYVNILFDSNNILNIRYVNICNICYNNKYKSQYGRICRCGIDKQSNMPRKRR